MKTAIITDSTATLSEKLKEHPAVFQVFQALSLKMEKHSPTNRTVSHQKNFTVN